MRLAVPEVKKIQVKGDGAALGRPRNGENPRKRGRRRAWPSPKWRKSREKGTASRLAVPEMKKTQEKCDGAALGRPRNEENPGKRGRRCAWPSPKWRKSMKSGTVSGLAVPEMKKIHEKCDGAALGRPRNGENRRKRGRRHAWLSPISWLFFKMKLSVLLIF